MTRSEDTTRLDAIVREASKLSVEHQVYILATIKGMLLSRSVPPEPHRKSVKKGRC